MKKIAALIIIFTFVASSQLYANDLLGIYTTKPEIFPGFDKPYSEVVKKAIESMTWRMKITDKGVRALYECKCKVWQDRRGRPSKKSSDLSCLRRLLSN